MRNARGFIDIQPIYPRISYHIKKALQRSGASTGTFCPTLATSQIGYSFWVTTHMTQKILHY